jgi:3-phenylpropionate/cinnamic acid dioxygenase small subunit
MPIRRTVTLNELDREFTRIGDMAFFDDDKNDLAMRVSKFQTGSSWSEDPPSRTRHNISNVRVTSVDGDEITVTLNFHLYRARLEDKTDEWTGKRIDVVRRTNGSFLLCQRHIYLDQTVIQSTNMSSLF